VPEPNDTIAAIATPPGRGGIGILRLSGPEAVAIASPLLRLRAPLAPGRARFCEVIDPATSEKLDEAIATYFAAPHSYTGEHVLEIAAHGSPVLLDFLLRQVIARGARLANPGEFTERAFLAGRLDLTQAEAVRDLIDSQTLYQARIAASQLDGALSRRVAPIKAALVTLIAQLEAGIDFAEDDTPTLSAAAILTQTAPIAAQLATLAHSFEHGRLVHAGLTLAIVGEPNVGKSSLFNRLVERERAIVTATPGTTRDLVTERVSIAGIPIELVDTAGLRAAADEAERLGIEKSREALAEADLVLVVLDATELFSGELLRLAEPNCSTELAPRADMPHSGLAGEPMLAMPLAAFLAATRLDSITAEPPDLGKSKSNSVADLLASLADRRSILVLNKCDLLPGDVKLVLRGAAPGDSGSVVSYLQPYLQPWLAHIFGDSAQSPIVATSAHTGEGLAELRKAIEVQLQTPALAEQGGMLTNLRQHQAVEAARAAIETAQAAIQLPHEMLLLDLYTALRNLDALTGETTPDDILNLIFSTFCIGK
jgi:tRNA U34 5-carboxymethylaminomethyl modifying GTPase MnmE/TrmE